MSIKWYVCFRQCWEILVWVDIANFGGVKGKLPEEIENGSQVNEQSERDNESDDDEDEREKEVCDI